jgi:hypothetical protein
MYDNTWIVMPGPVEETLQRWSQEYPQYVALDWVEGYSGYRTYAVILTDTARKDEVKRKILFLQPHGHEPAQTAAQMDIINQLLTGYTLDGEESDSPVNEILENMVLVFNPIGNPDGRSRIPVPYWNERFDYHTAASYWTGRLRGADRYWEEGNKYCIIHPSEHDLDPDYPIGLRWEKFEDDSYIDGWNATVPLERNESTVARLAMRILSKHSFEVVLDLHQCPEADDVQIWLPLIRSTTSRQTIAERIALSIENNWRKIHLPVKDRVTYEKQFISSIHDYNAGKPAILTIEVGAGIRPNGQSAVIQGAGSRVMSRGVQKMAGIVAIKGAIEFLLNEMK